MKKVHMAMRSITVGLGVAVLAGAGAVVYAQQPARGVITLAAAGGSCAATVVGNEGSSDLIRSRRGRAIQWTVVNNCAAAADVALVDWVRKSDRAAAHPGDPNGRLSCNVRAGARCMLTMAVRGNAETTTYSYTVSVNGLDLDPDVIIDP